MGEIIFVEGVSGVGKSTLVSALTGALAASGYAVDGYVEFDFRNPIDFYCAAYFKRREYDELCAEYASDADAIRLRSIDAGEAVLVRYYDCDTPLFSEPLLSRLSEREFCYHPARTVSFNDYASACVRVFENFAKTADKFDFAIFDGSLMHHPINDMLRNYGVSVHQAVAQVNALLGALGGVKRRICYLRTDDIAKQLSAAHADRRQDAPSDDEILFWRKRESYDMSALADINERCDIFDVTGGGWDAVRDRMLHFLRH